MNRSASAAAMFVVFFVSFGDSVSDGKADMYEIGGIDDGRTGICCTGENGCFGTYGA